MGLLVLFALLGCFPTEPDKPGGPSLAGEWDVVPPPCEVMAGWNQPAQLAAALEFVRFGREDGLEEHVRIEPDGEYQVTIVRDGEVVERYDGVLTPVAVAELAGLLYDWQTDAAAIQVPADAENAADSTLPQPLPEREGGSGADSAKGGESGTDSASRPCESVCGRYEITYAGRTCGWPGTCAVVPRALKCLVLKIVESTALDRGCVRMEFLDR